MCGIAGFFDPSMQDYSKSKVLMENMLSSIAHRGPDNSSINIEFPIALGHNRLSIIDLAETANQPMEYQDLVLVFNGEIYNYIEIRQELIEKGLSFKTQSDTEVVVAAYSHWGESCVEKFVGMWSFAIWDKRSRVLFCSRDRFGIKPFCYISYGQRFYFASEYKPLKLTPFFDPKINDKQVLRGLQLGWMAYKDETYFEQINALPEGCNLIVKNGNVEVKKYWDIDTSLKTTETDFNQKKHDFFQLFSDSIKLHYRSDVEVGVCLSGGLDSSAILSMAASIFPEKEIKSFTIYYEGKDAVDERPFANEVIKKYKNIVPFYYTPSEKEIQDALEHVLHHADVPISGSSPVSQYFLMKLAKEHGVKVLLDGQGSDEYLCGYMHTFNRLIGQKINRGKCFQALKILNQHKKEHNLSSKQAMLVLLKAIYASSHSEQDVFNYELKKINPLLRGNLSRINTIQLDEKPEDKMANFNYHLLFSSSLPTLLHYEDRNSMAFSLESRVPFLDHRLVEYGFSLPIEDKIHNAETKYILRKALSGILPDAITNRKDKKGFVTPGEDKWLRGPLKHLLEDDFTLLNQWVNPYQFKKLLYNYKNGDNSQAKLLWRLVMLNLWWKKL
ncbi:MAG: asparagine synthase (glutamine-hydrolyzing) [Bacteroidota bacterium]|nr:asparagine synthase (glutamine-hydrolyzing) [Bacteroidota bacterium]